MPAKVKPATDTVLGRLGVPRVTLPNRPMPTMPTKFSTLSDDSLGDLMAVYSAWREYIEDALAYMAINYTIARDKHDLLRKRTYIMVTARNRELRDAMADVDDDVVAAYEEFAGIEIEYEMLSAKLASLDKSIASLSREITRRG